MGTLSKHDMDEATEFCRKCGASALGIIDRHYLCTDAANVSGISHLIARRKLAPIVKPVLDNYGVDFLA